MIFSLSKSEGCSFVSRKSVSFATMKEIRQLYILTITGSDGTGGSGVQADIKTINALGGHALSAITSVTMQNTLGIQEFFDLPSSVVARQMEAIMDDVIPSAVKIGMIRNVETVKAIARLLEKYRPQHVVYDPVVTTSRGELLMNADVVDAIAEYLVPLCHVITKREKDRITVIADGKSFPLQQIIEGSAHGFGGTLSSAIATFLGQGNSYEDAIMQANSYVNRQMAFASNLQGRSSELYNEFLNQLTTHYATNRDVHFYADSLNVSPRYLAQVTRRIARKSPKAIIDEYLLKEIMLTLGSSEKNIQEVAYSFGFSSQSHFTKFFRKMTGDTPTHFRISTTEARGNRGV